MAALTEILGYLLQTFLSLYLLAMLLRFLLQWVRADFYNPISQFLVKITNPLIVPVRRLIPGVGGIDLSDNYGGRILFDGTITTSGANGGGGVRPVT